MIERNWNELIRPEKPQIEIGADASRKARLVAEPLERGFGVTLGNSLRRVLLSSLQGAAVTAVQIDGVVHEFSSLEGVREDVVDIVLNIKQLALRMHAEGPKRMTLRATGPGAVTAGQIEAPSDIEILNPDHVLCTLDDGATVRMEFTVQTGKGYVPAEMNRPEDALIGVMYYKDPVNADMVIDDATNWTLQGTGLVAGSIIPGAIGYEADRMFGNAPASPGKTHSAANPCRPPSAAGSTRTARRWRGTGTCSPA